MDSEVALLNSSAAFFANVPGLQPEVLYGTAQFQVRLWTIPPERGIQGYPQAPATHSQSFLIEGDLALSDTDGLSEPMMRGQRWDAVAEFRWRLENVGQQSALLLEIAWGEGFPLLALPPVTETRPWGSFTVLKDEPAYKLKQLVATPDHRLSLQRHQHREEHWLVTRGEAEITLDERQLRLKPGAYIKIPCHSWHRLANTAPADSGELVEIIELQLGSYFGEDDIERREDDYGRA